MASIAYRDQELEESFSFSSCYDFNSSSFQSIFSDESDDESYIEIALEQKNYHGDIDDWADEEMELRISFSSSAPFQEPSSTTTSIEYEPAATMSKSPSSSSTTTTSTMNPSSPSKEGDQWDAQMGSKASNSTFRIQKTIKRRAQFPKVHGFLNMLKPSLTVSSEVNDENGRPANSNHLELVRPSTMKGSKETAMNSSSIVMKFLVKFRALRIRTLLASFMKSRQEINFPRGKKSIGAYQTLIKPSDKWLVRKGQGSSSNSNNPFGDGERSRVMEKNLDAIRGVLEAMSTSVGGKDRKSKSCPSSTKSSPAHLGFSSGNQNHKICAQDNSIQAAIAHCKRSFGQSIV